MDDLVRAGTWLAVRLPSDTLKILEIQPNTTISLGKYGSFQANHLIGRPYHATYEILDKSLDATGSKLQIVSASDLHEIELGEATTPDIATSGDGGVEYDAINEEGKVIMRSNQHINDGESTQKLTAEEIDALKKADGMSGKEIIAKLLESHSAIDKKTSFSLAKYTQRKAKKYMKRFTVLPMDIPLVINNVLDAKDSLRIMDIREETLSLMMSYANAHPVEPAQAYSSESDQEFDHNRWLVVDEVSGLLVAALAERMGILYQDHDDNDWESLGDNTQHIPLTNGFTQSEARDEPGDQQARNRMQQQSRIRVQEAAMSGTANTITIIHQNPQPNLSLLTYFGYDVSNPNTNHPLYTNLKEISFLQLVYPEEDYACQEPQNLSEAELKELKSRQKSNYWRKRRRWQRTKAIVDETQAGNFAGLVVASVMSYTSVLHRLVPLLRGGAQVVIYSPTVEQLAELVDCYSKSRRTAFLEAEDPVIPSAEFPVDPRLLVGTALHTVRSRPWQVLPGRTHPKMSGRGGSEGYVFLGTRVHPAEGRVTAHHSNKRRKLGINGDTDQAPQAMIKEESLDDNSKQESQSIVTGENVEGILEESTIGALGEPAHNTKREDVQIKEEMLDSQS